MVMVNVRAIAEMGAYVYLLEYNNIEGMILLSELSRRRIRSINKLIRVGKTEPVVVIRVDKEKGKCHNCTSFRNHPSYPISKNIEKYSDPSCPISNKSRLYRSVEASCIGRRCRKM